MKVQGPRQPKLPPEGPDKAAGAASNKEFAAGGAHETKAAEGPAWVGELRGAYRKRDLDNPEKAAEMVARVAGSLVSADPSAAALRAEGQARVASWIANDPLFAAALRQQLERILT